MNGLTSVKAQLPYSYYHLPYCRPNVITSHVESLGEILMGETVENSPYDVRPALIIILTRLPVDR